MHNLQTTFLATGVFTLGLTNPVTAQWVRQSPFPYPALDARSVAFPTPTHGYIVGTEAPQHGLGPTVLRETLDGGQTWATVPLPGTQQNMKNVFFLDALHGWTVGNSSVMAENDNFRTVDGGLTWQAMQLPLGTWKAVHFLDPNFGWAEGFNGGISITHDGGVTWQFQSLDVGSIRSADFANPQLGIGFSGTAIWRTTDGGANWTQVLAGSFTYSPKFLSPSALVVGVFPTGLMRSTDGGLTWNTVPNQNREYIVIVPFTPDIAIAVTPTGQAIRTTDAGTTWSPVAFPGTTMDFQGFQFVNQATAIRFQLSSVIVTMDAGATWSIPFSGPGIPLKDAAFRNTTDGLLVGFDGFILNTTDGGATWDYFSNGAGDDIFGIAMFDAQRGLAVGDCGLVLRTTDGGDHWIPVRPGPGRNLQVLGTQFAVAVGGLGGFWKTTDGGQTFTTSIIANGQFEMWDVAFVNHNEGWAVSTPAVIFHTVDGGTTWSSQFSNLAAPLTSVEFIDANHGWAAGPSSFIMRTTNGGATWTTSPISAPDAQFDIRFVDANVGWVVGNFGFIAKTTDGGLTWVDHSIATTEHITGLHVVNAQELWVATFNGRVHHSTDGGITWTQVPTGFESDPSLSFWGISLAPSGDIWVAGFAGTILKRSVIPVTGDINGDGVLDLSDGKSLAAVLVGLDTIPSHIAAADINGDGSADGLDIQPFVGVFVP